VFSQTIPPGVIDAQIGTDKSISRRTVSVIPPGLFVLISFIIRHLISMWYYEALRTVADGNLLHPRTGVSYPSPKHKRQGNFRLKPLNPELNPMCCLLALLGAHHFLHVSRISFKYITFCLLILYIYIYIYIYIWSTYS
jgi:hypothetical protein